VAINWIAVAIGGAAGACCRYAIALSFSSQTTKFPLATFIANGLGCFAMGIGVVLISEKMLLGDPARQFFLVGLLGAFTTYSTFAMEALVLFQKHDYKMALVYIAATLVTCLMGAFLGVALAKTIFN